MQEIELQQGFFTRKVDGKGIERLRFLAMQFEGMGEVKTPDGDVSYPLSLTNVGSAYRGRRAVLTAIRNVAETEMLVEGTEWDSRAA